LPAMLSNLHLRDVKKPLRPGFTQPPGLNPSGCLLNGLAGEPEGGISKKDLLPACPQDQKKYLHL